MKPAAIRAYATAASLVGILLVIKSVDILIDPEHVYPGRTAAFPWLELGIVTAALIISAGLSTRSELIRIWPGPPYAARLAQAAGLGLTLGVALAGLDSWTRIGDINVGLPLAPLFYLWGAISQETLTHFAPAAIIVGLLALFGAHHRGQVVGFWLVALIMSALAAASMAAAFQNPDIPLSTNVAAAPILIAAAVFAIELALFGVFRRWGFLAALVTRLAFYAVWHVAWPALAY